MQKSEFLNQIQNLCSQLAIRDRQKGFTNQASDSPYSNSYQAFTEGIFYEPNKPSFTLTEVLDDALNCNLITIAEYQNLTASAKQHIPNHLL